MSRSRASAKKAGSSFERAVADFLKELLSEHIDRRVKTGTKDRGDIGGVRTYLGARVVVEVKNVVKTALSSWLGQALVEAENDRTFYGVVVHKRMGVSAVESSYVTMDLQTFAALLDGGRDLYDDEDVLSD